MMRRKNLWASLAAFAALLAGAQAFGADQEKTIRVKSWNLCEFQTDLDGQWQGTRVASDGNVYFASSTHSSRTGAMFFKFDPRTEQLTVLCKDITRVCGEDPEKNATQGKIHSDVVEMDGWLYFGTHLAFEAKPYTGAHLVGYELASAKFRDFGVIHEGYSNYAGVTADRKGKAVYIYLVKPGQRNDAPCYLYRVDAATGEKRQVATLPAGGWDAAVYYLYADDAGNAWLPLPNGVLGKYDVAEDRLATFPNALPHPQELRYNQWIWTQPLPGKNQALFTSDSGRKLYLFDASGAAPAFRHLADLGGSSLAVGLAGDTVYYVMREGGREGKEHLKSVVWTAEKPEVVDYGAIVDQDGRTPQRIPALSADTEGRVYMTGDWNVLPGDTRTTRVTANRQTGELTFPPQQRSERFATVQVPKP